MRINTSRLFIKKQEIHGINPKLIYPTSGKSFELPRFISLEMHQARVLNKIAKYNEYQKLSNSIPAKATKNDLIQLTDDKYAYQRAVWINPKDRKGYFLLHNGNDKNGNINLRILNQDGKFVKNAIVTPKEVILTDLASGLKQNTEVLDMNFTHTDIIETLAARFNPFANYKIIHIYQDRDISRLSKLVNRNTSCVSASYGVYHYKSDIAKTGEEIKQHLLRELKNHSPNEIKLLEDLKQLTSKTRVLASSGNNGDKEIASLLLNTGFEGVGGLDYKGFVASASSSRNSLFTQHYEPYRFNITKTNNGINLSGLRGTDIVIETNKTIPTGKHLGYVAGTSYSTPVRAAKIALNEMMEGIL